ncbi:MAG: hypothetical protein ACRD1G_06740 [Acidimicrobiales bacterium]
MATFLLVGSTPAVSLEVASSPLMDQCSRHDIPPAITANLTDQQGHALDVRLKGLAPVSAHLVVAR